MKQLIVLVGPKGAGKSTIGHFLATELGIRFLRVEPIFLGVRAEFETSHPEFEQRGFEAVLACVAEEFSRYDTICIESTGASTRLDWYLASLREMARVHLVRVLATPGQCVERIKGRDSSLHIPVSDDQVDRINALAVQVSLPWSAELDNRGSFDPVSVRETMLGILEHEENGHQWIRFP